MVVVKRVVPPRTIFFLFAHDVPREVRDIYFLTIIGEHLKALGRVVKSVVVKVTRDREVGLVGNRSFSANIKPTFSETKSMKPVFKKFVGDSLIPKFPHRSHADL